MGTHKYFYCSKCDKKHQRPVGKNCPVVVTHDEDFSDLHTSASSSAASTGATESSFSVSTQDMNTLLLKK